MTTRAAFYIIYRLTKRNRLFGEVSEWSMVQHWKCCVRQRTAGSNPVLSAKTRKSRILCGIFCVLAERTAMKGFLVVRVSAEPTYAEAHTLAWETALSCPFLNENILGTSLPRILCGIFCVLAERTERKSFLVVRVPEGCLQPEEIRRGSGSKQKNEA